MRTGNGFDKIIMYILAFKQEREILFEATRTCVWTANGKGYRPVARIFYGWVRSVDYTDQRAPEALFTRGVRGHAPPGNFEN